VSQFEFSPVGQRPEADRQYEQSKENLGRDGQADEPKKDDGDDLESPVAHAGRRFL
jgi:hypothetical protein